MALGLGFQQTRRFVLTVFVALSFGAVSAAAQEPEHDHANMDMNAGSGWHLMQDGVVFAEFNDQSGPRGGREFVVPNWWMGMASRNMARGQMTLSAMFSLDPATVGKDGYRELFQAGEALDGQPLIDRQHPHDFFMQLGTAWRMPLGSAAALTIAGGPIGEPALGPVAFMHRASAAENPTAPLGHHTFDSTHIVFGVVTAAVDRGRWTAEGSVFNGRESDEDRWDFDFGPLDSFSGRLWYRPAPAWELQVSAGRLTDPEQLEPGNITRSTTSLSWTRLNGSDFHAVSAGFGRNDTEHGVRHAFFVEGTRHAGLNSVYGRLETVQTEIVHDVTDPVVALTFGAVRDVLRARGFEGGFGADVTVHAAPGELKSLYGNHPVGFRLFFRLRPPAGAMGRMVNMRMGRRH